MLAANQKMSNKFLHFAQHIDFIRKKSCLTRPGTWNSLIIRSFLPLTREKRLSFGYFVEASSVTIAPSLFLNAWTPWPGNPGRK
jgi:hypothetical protein